MADDLVVDAYRGYGVFPRRGAIRSSEPDPPRCCLGAGESRRGLCPAIGERDYLHFVGIAIGSASEVRYLVSLAVRLGFANEPDGQRLKVGYSRVIRGPASARDLSQLA